MQYCKVKRCRYSVHHVTMGHRCGTCKEYGHGQMECGNDELIAILSKFRDEVMPDELYCTYSLCQSRQSHSIKSHHSDYEIPSKFVLEKANDAMKNTTGKIHVIISVEMGCMWYIRRKNVLDQPEGFFMHSDSWGQYGPECDDRPQLNAFIEGFKGPAP